MQAHFLAFSCFMGKWSNFCHWFKGRGETWRHFLITSVKIKKKKIRIIKKHVHTQYLITHWIYCKLFHCFIIMSLWLQFPLLVKRFLELSHFLVPNEIHLFFFLLLLFLIVFLVHMFFFVMSHICLSNRTYLIVVCDGWASLVAAPPRFTQNSNAWPQVTRQDAFQKFSCRICTELHHLFAVVPSAIRWTATWNCHSRKQLLVLTDATCHFIVI